MSDKVYAKVATYRKMKNPAYVGQLRTKKWRCLVEPKDGDPMWSQRCRTYWDRQAQIFGLKFSDYRFWYNPYDETLNTTAQVLEILPGDRVDAG